MSEKAVFSFNSCAAAALVTHFSYFQKRISDRIVLLPTRLQTVLANDGCQNNSRLFSHKEADWADACLHSWFKSLCRFLWENISTYIHTTKERGRNTEASRQKTAIGADSSSAEVTESIISTLWPRRWSRQHPSIREDHLDRSQSRLQTAREVSVSDIQTRRLCCVMLRYSWWQVVWPEHLLHSLHPSLVY